MPESETLDIARSYLPILDGEDSKKSQYLSYRITNFSRAMATELTGIHRKTVARWREEDPAFAWIDGEGLSEARKTLANEVIDMQFTRNFHLVLQKDFRILYKDHMNSLGTGLPLTEEEQAYMLKIRQHYTPQSLAMVKQILAGGTVEEPFNFTKLTMTIKREREQIEIIKET